MSQDRSFASLINYKYVISYKYKVYVIDYKYVINYKYLYHKVRTILALFFK
jgi:hypothetical protein